MNTKLSMDEAMQALETAVAKLESGTLNLEESLAVFEDAVKLVALCKEKLNDAEQTVKMLIERSDGTITDVPFDTDNAT